MRATHLILFTAALAAGCGDSAQEGYEAGCLEGEEEGYKDGYANGFSCNPDDYGEYNQSIFYHDDSPQPPCDDKDCLWADGWLDGYAACYDDAYDEGVGEGRGDASCN